MVSQVEGLVKGCTCAEWVNTFTASPLFVAECCASRYWHMRMLPHRESEIFCCYCQFWLLLWRLTANRCWCCCFVLLSDHFVEDDGDSRDDDNGNAVDGWCRCRCDNGIWVESTVSLWLQLCLFEFSQEKKKWKCGSVVIFAFGNMAANIFWHRRQVLL